MMGDLSRIRELWLEEELGDAKSALHEAKMELAVLADRIKDKSPPEQYLVGWSRPPDYMVKQTGPDRPMASKALKGVTEGSPLSVSKLKVPQRSEHEMRRLKTQLDLAEQKHRVMQQQLHEASQRVLDAHRTNVELRQMALSTPSFQNGESTSML